MADNKNFSNSFNKDKNSALQSKKPADIRTPGQAPKATEKYSDNKKTRNQGL